MAVCLTTIRANKKKQFGCCLHFPKTRQIQILICVWHAKCHYHLINQHPCAKFEVQSSNKESTNGTGRVACFTGKKKVEHTVSDGGGPICIKGNNGKSHCDVWHFVHVHIDGAQVFSSRWIPWRSSDSDTVLCPGNLATHFLKNFGKFYITLCKMDETNKMPINRSLLDANKTCKWGCGYKLIWKRLIKRSSLAQKRALWEEIIVIAIKAKKRSPRSFLFYKFFTGIKNISCLTVCFFIYFGESNGHAYAKKSSIKKVFQNLVEISLEQDYKMIRKALDHTCKLLVPQPSTVTVPPVTAAPARK